MQGLSLFMQGYNHVGTGFANVNKEDISSSDEYDALEKQGTLMLFPSSQIAKE